jgi:hypothetical protein
MIKTIIVTVLFGHLLVVAGGAQAATILSQAPCVDPPNSYCLAFGPSGAVPTIRSRTLNASAAGRAIVTFHGTVVCLNPTLVKGGVELWSQIVNAAGANPQPGGQGGLLHTSVLPPEGSATFNLASTRVFNVPGAGRFAYSFKIRRMQMSAGVQCRVYNAAFTILVEP